MDNNLEELRRASDAVADVFSELYWDAEKVSSQSGEKKNNRNQVIQMIRFTGKCLLIAIVMFFGVLFGMQQANSGMLDMKGYKDPSLKGAFTLGGGEGQEKSFHFGTNRYGERSGRKTKQLEQAETFNLFSKAGETLSNTVTDSAQAMYEWVSKLNR